MNIDQPMIPELNIKILIVVLRLCYYVIRIRKYTSNNLADKVFCLFKVRQTFDLVFQEPTLFSIQNKDGGAPAAKNQSQRQETG